MFSGTSQTASCFIIVPYAGHYYEVVVLSSAVPFANLYGLSAARTFRGVSGHVLTVTGLGEQAFVSNFLQQSKVAAGASLAAFDGRRIGATNSFKYTTGPEAGVQFTFTNWDSASPITGQSQPDLAITGLNCVLMSVQTGRWSDQNCGSGVSIFIVEYECPAGFLFNATGCFGLSIDCSA